MYRDKKILALIPARGGSKGIPGKNIKELAGKPLIAHTIEAAKNCSLLDDVIVTTDSREIADVSRQYGAWIPCLRPKNLASDTAKTVDAVCHMVDYLKEQGREYDLLVLLQPTSPLRNAEDIEGAVRLAVESGEDVAGICEVKDSPILIRRMDEKNRLSKLLEQSSTIRRQEMPVYYRVSGSIYVNWMCRLNRETSFNDNPLGYLLPPERSVDIDEAVDFYLAEYYMRH